MTTIREFYQNEVESQWHGKIIPKLTEHEAIEVARRLYRKFRVRTDGRKRYRTNVTATTGRRYSGINREFSGVAYIKANWTRGWQALVHEMSHSLHYRNGGKGRPHDRPHGALERAMIQHVIDSGWLAGALASPAKEKPKPDVKRVRYERVLSRVKAWETKMKRAKTALAKLAVQKRYYEKSLSDNLVDMPDRPA